MTKKGLPLQEHKCGMSLTVCFELRKELESIISVLTDNDFELYNLNSIKLQISTTPFNLNPQLQFHTPNKR